MIEIVWLDILLKLIEEIETPEVIGVRRSNVGMKGVGNMQANNSDDDKGGVIDVNKNLTGKRF